MYLGYIGVQMLLEVIELGEITQLVREDREERGGEEKRVQLTSLRKDQ